MKVGRGRWSECEEGYLLDKLALIENGEVSIDDVAKKLNRSYKSVINKYYRLGGSGLPKDEYALYKGEEIIALGTVVEIAKQLNTKEGTVRYYGTKRYRKRTSDKARRLIKIQEG